MSDSVEVLVTSEATSRFWSACVWDVRTGNVLHTYKGGGVLTANTLRLVRNDYVLAAECLKPLLHVWPVNSQEVAKGVRLVCPGRVTALDVSHDGNYCAAGIADQLYVWHLPSGSLLAVASKHFQPITKVAFSSDGTHVVTAGEDGLLLVWALAQLVSQHSHVAVRTEQIDPVHTISDHSLAIKDFCVGKVGRHARLVSVSADRTMKIYELATKSLLLTVVFDVSLTAVALNLSETFVYVGATDGSVFELSLLNPPRNREYHVEPDKSACFKGHKKAVTTLCVSLDGRMLASGAHDDEVIIWHVETKQKIRSLPHKGAINNAFFTIAPKNLFAQDLRPSTVVSSFARSLLNEQQPFVVEVITNADQQPPRVRAETPAARKPLADPTDHRNDIDLLAEIEKLKAINSKLYQFTLNKIIDEPKLTIFEDASEKTQTRKRKCL